MQLEVKYDRNNHRVIVEDISSGIIGRIIRVKDDDDAYRVMSSIDLEEAANRVKEISLHNT